MHALTVAEHRVDRRRDASAEDSSLPSAAPRGGSQ